MNKEEPGNITAMATAEKKSGEQAEFANAILNASINALLVCTAIRDENGKITDFRMVKINRAFTSLTKKTAEEIEGKMYSIVFPTAMTSGLFEIRCKVIETGEPVRKEIYYKGEGLDAWYDMSYVKLDDDTLVVTFTDITIQKKASQEIEQQKNLLDNILKRCPSGISVTKVIRNDEGKVVDGKTILSNNVAEQYTGIPGNEYLTKRLTEIDPNIMESSLFKKSLSTLETGEPFLTQHLLETSGKWLELGVSKMDEDHLINVFTDISSTKEAQLGVERFAAKLKKFINSAHTGMAYLMPVKNEKGEVIDFLFDIINNTFAAYTGNEPEAIEGQLVSKWFPGYYKNALFDKYKHTYNTGETTRFERNYEDKGINAWFDILATRSEDGLLVTLTDLTTLKKLQIELEASVTELKKTNGNLQEFAYVASHDLQEPLRKIQIFSQRLVNDLAKELSEDNKKIFERMIAATERMSQLINDLLAYSQLTTKTPAFKPVNLKNIIQQVSTDLEESIKEKNAVITVGELPTVQGDFRQLSQLFQNLLSNSIKYSKTGCPTLISITAEKVEKERNGAAKCFHQIQITDNGIGFEQQYAERIFKVFQRLHGRSEYPGTGIGLAIVQKVVENHRGFITAASEPGKGAIFNIFLPA